MDELRAIHHPHDALFRSVFGDPDLAGELLRTALPPELHTVIDWDGMRRLEGSFVDEELGGHEADLLFETTAAGRPTLLFLLLSTRPTRIRSPRSSCSATSFASGSAGAARTRPRIASRRCCRSCCITAPTDGVARATSRG